MSVEEADLQVLELWSAFDLTSKKVALDKQLVELRCLCSHTRFDIRVHHSLHRVQGDEERGCGQAEDAKREH